MTLATFNVNSIRARMPRLLEWLAEADPDFVAIQETKVEDDKFPFADLEPTGYHVSVHGQKSYNGVCLLSKHPMTDVVTGFGDADMPTDCRIVRCQVGGVLVINTYVPNGTAVGGDKWAYKMAWMERFAKFCTEVASPSDKVVWLGDINVAPTPDDVYEPERHLGDVGHHPDEFERLQRIVDWGWTDMFRSQNQDPDHYTFWDFRIPNSLQRNLGWRIDHIYTTEPLAGTLSRCWVDKHVRGKERPSDHAPVLASFQWE